MMDFVNWDDDMPNMMEQRKFMFQTTNQNLFSWMIFTFRILKLNLCLDRGFSSVPRLMTSEGKGMISLGMIYCPVN